MLKHLRQWRANRHTPLILQTAANEGWLLSTDPNDRPYIASLIDDYDGPTFVISMALSQDSAIHLRTIGLMFTHHPGSVTKLFQTARLPFSPLRLGLISRLMFRTHQRLGNFKTVGWYAARYAPQLIPPAKV